MIVLGEQDGEAERVLKRDVCAKFAQVREVRSAHLMRIKHEEFGSPVVAMLLYCDSDSTALQRSLVDLIQKTFAPTFDRTSSLDVIFISEAQARRLYHFCAPFYSNAVGA